MTFTFAINVFMSSLMALLTVYVIMSLRTSDDVTDDIIITDYVTVDDITDDVTDNK